MAAGKEKLLAAPKVAPPPRPPDPARGLPVLTASVPSSVAGSLRSTARHCAAWASSGQGRSTAPGSGTSAMSLQKSSPACLSRSLAFPLWSRRVRAHCTARRLWRCRGLRDRVGEGSDPAGAVGAQPSLRRTDCRCVAPTRTSMCRWLSASQLVKLSNTRSSDGYAHASPELCAATSWLAFARTAEDRNDRNLRSRWRRFLTALGTPCDRRPQNDRRPTKNRIRKPT
jgi:hypothetical protein